MNKLKVFLAVVILSLLAIGNPLLFADSNTLLNEAEKECNVIFLKDNPKVIFWSDSYQEINHGNEIWFYFNFNLLNVIGDGGGLLLRKKNDGSWAHFWLGHDAPDPRIPKEVLEDESPIIKKNNYFGNKNARINEKTKDMIIENRDIRNFSVWSLELMKNEILARHGAAFKDQRLTNFFKTRNWYKYNSKFNTSQLSNIESRNIKIIYNEIESKKQH